MQVATEVIQIFRFVMDHSNSLPPYSGLWNYALKMFTSCVEAIGQPAQGNGLSNGDHNENDCNNLKKWDFSEGGSKCMN
jgi:hypothetical protein